MGIRFVIYYIWAILKRLKFSETGENDDLEESTFTFKFEEIKSSTKNGRQTRAVASFSYQLVKRDNGNVHRAAAKDMQAEKAARPAAPCATYCYTAYRAMPHTRQS